MIRSGDIIDAGRAIFHDVDGMSPDEYMANRLVQDAVLYRLLKVSEAARKLGDAAESLMPEVPWPQVRAFGNAIRHGYDAIRHDEVWTI